MTKTEKLAAELLKIVGDYGQAMRTETNQYPNFVVVDQVLGACKKAGLEFVEYQCASEDFDYTPRLTQIEVNNG